MARSTLTRITGNYQVTVPKDARRDEFLKQLRKDIEAGKADVKAGRGLGPFDNARHAMRALRDFAKKRRAPARTTD
jgi:bifunctional DNA-binding transcriptional regulator/antitoxin component of YhaV-PrlF toxin-antitoxin module